VSPRPGADSVTALAPKRLSHLDNAVRQMLLTGERGGFDIIGAGEITCVVGIDEFACKRLPPVTDPSRLDAYGTLLVSYLGALKKIAIPVVETEWQTVPGPADHVGYIIQPRLPADTILHKVMASMSDAENVAVLSTILDHVDACVDAGIGIDPQFSNWAMADGRPLLLDVTTPMLRDEDGNDLLDTEVFVVMLPVVIRSFVRRFMIGDLLNKNFEKHGILLDLIGNIVNYDLDHLTEVFLPIVNERLEAPLTMKEIKGYRREEYWTWLAIRKALQIEQFWQRRIRGKPTLHLLPSEFVAPS